MRVEAEVSRRRGLGWTLGASGAFLLFFATQRDVTAVTFVGIAAFVCLLAFAALRVGAQPFRRRAVRVDGRGLWLDDALAVPRPAFRHAHVHDEDEHHTVTLETRALSPSYTFRLPSARLAQALVDALEHAVDDAVVFDALPPWAHRLRWLAVVLTASPWILLNVVRHLPGAFAVVLLGLYALVLAPMVVPRKVLVGEDGISLRWAGRGTYLPFTSVVSVQGTALGVAIDLTDGRTLEVRLGHRGDIDGGRRRALLARIEAGIAAHRASGPADDEEALLARGRRTYVAWLEDLRTLARAEGYRSVALPRERLWRLLENPAAEPSAREGAAIALRFAATETERERISSVATKSASPRLRVTLDAVAKHDPAPELFEAADQVKARGA